MAFTYLEKESYILAKANAFMVFSSLKPDVLKYSEVLFLMSNTYHITIQNEN